MPTKTASTNGTVRKGTTVSGDVLQGTKPIMIQRLKQECIEVEIKGQTPIIPHKWSEKAVAQMRSKQFGETVQKLPPKNPEEEAYQATYWLPDGRPGMPATAFKAAMVGACRLFDDPPMTMAKLLFYVEGEGPEQLVPIECDAIEMREDLPRNSNGNPDLRYRNQLVNWRARLRVWFIASRIDHASVVALLDAAGKGGVGDWRPSAPKSATGMYGTWEVVTE
jgi:hypothetical protein